MLQKISSIATWPAQPGRLHRHCHYIEWQSKNQVIGYLHEYCPSKWPLSSDSSFNNASGSRRKLKGNTSDEIARLCMGAHESLHLEFTMPVNRALLVILLFLEADPVAIRPHHSLSATSERPCETDGARCFSPGKGGIVPGSKFASSEAA